MTLLCMLLSDLNIHYFYFIHITFFNVILKVILVNAINVCYFGVESDKYMS